MQQTETTPNIRRRVAISTVSQIASQLFVAILGVVSLKIMTRSLGIANYGVYATVLVFVSTFALLTDLGLNAITAREIARNPVKADDIISHNMGLRIFLCLVMVPLIFGLSFVFYPKAVNELRIGILLMSLYLFFDAIRSVSLAYFIAKVRNEIIAAINAFQQVVLVILVIVVATLNWGIYGYILIFLFSNVLVAVIALYLARKKVKVRPRINIKKWKAILAMSASLGIIQLINMMYLKADSIVLSTISGTTAVGIYAIAYSLIMAFLTIPGFIMTSLLPSMATADNLQIKSLVQKAYQYLAILACLLSCGAFIVKNDIVPFVSGPGFSSAAIPFAILALATAFGYVNSVFGFASVALNKHHKLIYVSFGCLILNILLNLLLVPKYSVNGAAWATAVSELLALITSYIIFRKETGVAIHAFSPLIRPILCAVTTILIVESLHSFWSYENHFINLIVSSIMTAVSFITLLTILRSVPSELTEFLRARLAKN